MHSRQLVTFGANEHLLDALHESGVRFLVVGGLAVNFHDSGRTPDDLDLLIEPTVENARRLVAAVGSLGLSLPVDAVERLVAGRSGFPVRQWSLYADILSEPGEDFSRHWEAASEARIGNVPVRVASIATLLERLSRSTESKHADDIERLRRLQHGVR